MRIHHDGSVSFTKFDQEAWDRMSQPVRDSFETLEDLRAHLDAKWEAHLERNRAAKKRAEERAFRDLMDDVTPSLAANMLGVTPTALDAMLASA